MRTVEITLDSASNNYFIKEAFNTLRTNILFSGKDIKSIIVTSCMAHEGKTTVSFEMAKSLAENDKKVLLIDADLRKSVTVSRYTKERGVVGLSQILSGQVSLEQSIYRTQITGMDMIFAGPFPPNPAELVGSDAFKELLDCVRGAYDYIIVDAPPLGLVIDAAIMASVCDGAVVVINQGMVKYRTAQNVKAQLNKSGCRILGVVLNQTQRKKHSARGGKSAYYSHYGTYYQSSEMQPPKAPVPPPRTTAGPAGQAMPRSNAPAGAARPMPPRTGTAAPQQNRTQPVQKKDQ